LLFQIPEKNLAWAIHNPMLAKMSAMLSIDRFFARAAAWYVNRDDTCRVSIAAGEESPCPTSEVAIVNARIGNPRC
jgi:hypothetical protein